MTENSDWVVRSTKPTSKKAEKKIRKDFQEVANSPFSIIRKEINDTNNAVIKVNEDLNALSYASILLGHTRINESNECKINLGNIRAGKKYFIHFPCIENQKLKILKPQGLRVETYQNHSFIEFKPDLPRTRIHKEEEIDVLLDERNYRLVANVFNTKLKIVLWTLLPTAVTLISLGIYLSGLLQFLGKLFGL